MDTVLKVRLAAKRDGKSLRGIADKYQLARNTVRKYVRTEETEPGYRRRRPKEKPKIIPPRSRSPCWRRSSAQRTGRTCYAAELEPRYCDIVLVRWEALTTQQACLVEAG